MLPLLGSGERFALFRLCAGAGGKRAEWILRYGAPRASAFSPGTHAKTVAAGRPSQAVGAYPAYPDIPGVRVPIGLLCGLCASAVKEFFASGK